MRDHGEYVSMTEAAKEVGLSDPAFRLRVQRGALPVHRDPRDWRRKLIRRADLDNYFGPAANGDGPAGGCRMGL